MQNSKKDTLVKIFQKVQYQPSPDLALNIWTKLVTRDKHIAQFRLWGFSVAGITSFILLIPAFSILSKDLAQSGFSEYFSIIFSDGGLAVSYWKEFLFSLAESLPVLSSIFVLSMIFICFLSVKKLMQQLSENELLSLTTLSI